MIGNFVAPAWQLSPHLVCLIDSLRTEHPQESSLIDMLLSDVWNALLHRHIRTRSKPPLVSANINLIPTFIVMPHY